MNAFAHAVYCKRCQKPAGTVDDVERCFPCFGALCGKCWDESGNCGCTTVAKIKKTKKKTPKKSAARRS